MTCSLLSSLTPPMASSMRWRQLLPLHGDAVTARPKSFQSRARPLQDKRLRGLTARAPLALG